MNFRNTGHKIATGTLTVASMAGVSAITAFSNQSDQVGGIPPWTAPRLSMPALPHSFSTTLSGKRVGLGYREFTWEFSYMTFGMLDYFIDTFLTTSGTIVYSKECTVMQYDHADVAQYFNCLINYPDYKKAVSGYKDVIFNFTMGTIIT